MGVHSGDEEALTNWIVSVSRRGDLKRKRVFVEDIEHKEEAERLALLKLGVNPLEHNTHAEIVDIKVSILNPNDPKELYEKALIELDEVKQKYKKEQSLSIENLKRAERAERDLDRLTKSDDPILGNLAQIRFVIDEIENHLEKRKR